MATPPGGRGYDGGAHRMPGEHSHNRYNFPSAPSGQGAQQPYQQQSYPPHDAQPYPPHDQQQDPQRYDPRWYPPQEQERYDQPQYDQQQQRYQQRQRPPEPPSHQNAHNPLVRPYAMTGGRTRPRYQLALEALVSTTADPARLQGQLPEHQRICRLCFEIKSVAEISALLHIPLGVARILVADLAEAGMVAIHQPGGDEAVGGQPDVTLLERVLSGLRKL
ncbi:DUF742 domain-containing protein [Streptomyces albipurpureus]|uniref:DUF742 domain-containing protein n=1 Tax=Streptomyces albipurpureus TaxID=2897419 RepID=A0ABT0UZ94_9ACTN|nr:DUF742 domain-containing protein [Streptomyces sp. CWNU-1]MCM2393294.1 DUF742 domain-containing protein [Streptomyces sp. CWNU-1]